MSLRPRIATVTVVMLLAVVTPASANDRAICYATAKATDDARLKACERLITSGAVRGRNLAITYTHRGVAYKNMGEFDRAIAEFNEALRRGFNEALTYIHLAEANLGKKDYDRAIVEADNALRLDPKNHIAYNSRASAYFHKGDYDRALADLTQAIGFNPRYVASYHNRGETYFRKRQFDLAIADFDLAIQIDPKIPAVYSGRGMAYAGKGDYDRAIANFNSALQRDPRNEILFINRGTIYALKRDFEKARADFRSALSINPRSDHAAQAIAQIEQGVAAPPPSALAPATGKSVRELLERRGWLGTWAQDCTKPASAENPYSVYQAVDTGRVQRDVMVGPAERALAGVVVAATERNALEVSIDVISHAGASDPIRDSMVVRTEGVRVRLLEFTRNGTMLISDGRNIQSQTESPWAVKCR